MKSRSLLKIAKYIIATCAGFAVTVLVVVTDWYAAYKSLSRTDGTCRRLRWYVAAVSEVPKGTKIIKQHLTSRFGLVRDCEDVIPSVKMATGKYALADIRENASLSRNLLADRPDVIPPPRGAVLPLQMRSELTEALRPGMHLAFVKEKKMFPTSINNVRGFLLISMTPSADNKTTVLYIEVPGGESTAIPFLATGEWRPVIIAAE